MLHCMLHAKCSRFYGLPFGNVTPVTIYTVHKFKYEPSGGWFGSSIFQKIFKNQESRTIISYKKISSHFLTSQLDSHPPNFLIHLN